MVSGRIMIQSKEDGLCPFVLTPVQAIVARDLNDALIAGKSFWAIILKSRQTRMSTFWVVFFFCLMVTTPGLAGLIVGNRTRSCDTLWDMLRVAKDSHAESGHARFETVAGLGENTKRRRDNARQMMLPNRSKMTLEVCSDDMGRSGGFSVALLSEFDFYEENDDVTSTEEAYATFKAALPEKARSIVVIESTVRAAGGMFQRMCEAAEKGEGRYKFYFFPWFAQHGMHRELQTGEEERIRRSLTSHERWLLDTVHDVHGYECRVTVNQLAWRRDEINEYGEDKFRKNHPATSAEAFEFAGDCAFNADVLREMLAEAEEPRWRGEIRLRDDIQSFEIQRERDLDRRHMPRLEVFREPLDKHEYFIAADPASENPLQENLASEAALYVWDATLGEEAAHWTGRCNPGELADICKALRAYYSLCRPGVVLTIPEANNYGHAFIERYIHGLGVPYTEVYHDLTEARDTIEARAVIGWQQNNKNKVKGVSALQRCINGRRITVHSEKTIRQLMTFVEKSEGIYEKARRSDKDDLVDCLFMVVHESMKGRAWGPADQVWKQRGSPTVSQPLAPRTDEDDELDQWRDEQAEEYASLYG
jgi:hypothetical protein